MDDAEFQRLMAEEPKAVLLARLFVVAYNLGYMRKGDGIPTNISDMMSKGHDGLNWQLFLPLAQDFLK